MPPTPSVLLLIGPDGGNAVHLTTIEVSEADLALLAEFADALDRAAGPRPGPGFEALTQALGEIGRVPYYSGMPEGDETTVARRSSRLRDPEYSLGASGRYLLRSSDD